MMILVTFLATAALKEVWFERDTIYISYSTSPAGCVTHSQISGTLTKTCSLFILGSELDTLSSIFTPCFLEIRRCLLEKGEDKYHSAF